MTGHHLAIVLLLVAALFAFDAGERGLGATACALVLAVALDASAQRGRPW